MSRLEQINKIRFELAGRYLRRRNLAGAIELAWEILDDQPDNRKAIGILKTARDEELKLSAAA